MRYVVCAIALCQMAVKSSDVVESGEKGQGVIKGATHYFLSQEKWGICASFYGYNAQTGKSSLLKNHCIKDRGHTKAILDSSTEKTLDSLIDPEATQPKITSAVIYPKKGLERTVAFHVQGTDDNDDNEIYFYGGPTDLKKHKDHFELIKPSSLLNSLKKVKELKEDPNQNFLSLLYYGPTLITDKIINY